MNFASPGVYLDHAASSPLRPAAREAWLAASEFTGNANATHSAGQSAKRVLEDAREQVAALLGAQPAEVIFTSGGTEGAALAVLGTPGPVVVSAIEHPAVLESARMRAARGEQVAFVPAASSGRVDPAELAAAISASAISAQAIAAGTGLVSLMWVNNETGVVQPIREMVAAAHATGALAHSDAVQAVGHLEVNFQESGLDLLSLSGHKFGAPKGTGVLLARKRLTLTPLAGGGGQERKVRSGTVDVAGAAALAAALGEAVAARTAEAARLREFRTQIAGALAALPGVRITGANLAEDQRAPGIVHAIFEGLRSEDLLFALDRAGIQASAGSACTAGVHQPSHVVLAMGGTDAEAAATLRCSLGWSTSQADVAAIVTALPQAVERARGVGTKRL